MKEEAKGKGDVLRKLFFYMFISQYIYIWRRLCDRDADEKEICG